MPYMSIKVQFMPGLFINLIDATFQNKYFIKIKCENAKLLDCITINFSLYCCIIKKNIFFHFFLLK